MRTYYQVPAIAPQQPPFTGMPSILLTYDRFEEPRPFRLDWVIDTEAVQPQIIDLLECHATQVFEWLPSLIPGQDGPYDTAWLTGFISANLQPSPKSTGFEHRSRRPKICRGFRGV